MDTKLLIDLGKQTLVFLDQNFMLCAGIVTTTGILIKIIKERSSNRRNYKVLYHNIKRLKRYNKLLNKVD